MTFNRRDARLALALNVGLALLVLVSFASGWFALFSGLSEFGLHKYSSIALTVAIVVHTTLHHRMLTRRWRRL